MAAGPAAAPDPLVADCARCAGLCCVALPFASSADFALDKAAGVPCPNLGHDHRCAIHADLRASGFGGCVAFDCLGAGQRVTQVTFGGRSWRTDPSIAEAMFGAFRVMRQLHDLLWLLRQAAGLPDAAAFHAEVVALHHRLDAVAQGDAASVSAVDLDALRQEVGPLLQAAGDAARRSVAHDPPDLSRRDLLGARLSGRDLRGADLRAALLVGADLRGADLRRASLLGADLRGADLRGADLTGAIYLTQAQLEPALGDEATKISPPLAPPATWEREGARDS